MKLEKSLHEDANADIFLSPLVELKTLIKPSSISTHLLQIITLDDKLRIKTLNQDAKANVDLSQLFKPKPHIFSLIQLLKIPTKLLWMLSVDGKFFKTENGPLGFEKRERNSVAGILLGLSLAIRYLGAQFSATELKNIHKICMTNVETKTSMHANTDIRGKFRDPHSSNLCRMEVEPGWSTKEGLAEIVKKGAPLLFQEIKRLETNQSVINFNKPLTKEADLKSVHADLESGKKKLYAIFPKIDIEKNVGNVFSNYNKKIDLLFEHDKATQENLLKFIARTVQSLTRIHPSSDGNNRTLINCFLNSQLIRLGLLPVILFEPNIFEFHTVLQLVKKIEAGIMITKRLIENPESEIFEFKFSALKLRDETDQKIFNCILQASSCFKEGIVKMLTAELSAPHVSFFDQRKNVKLPSQQASLSPSPF